jgi:hypothetical protein
VAEVVVVPVVAVPVVVCGRPLVLVMDVVPVAAVPVVPVVPMGAPVPCPAPALFPPAPLVPVPPALVWAARMLAAKRRAAITNNVRRILELLRNSLDSLWSCGMLELVFFLSPEVGMGAKKMRMPLLLSISMRHSQDSAKESV